jgi:tRNA pseudouridine13 synthase
MVGPDDHARPRSGEAAGVRGVPLLTRELPGTGGTLRLVPEDFEVEEVPAYVPSGQGEHLFLLVEKRGRNTRDVVQEVGRRLGVPERDIGVAGLKDRRALTRQWISVPGVAPESARGLSGEGFTVLEARRHGNKLRTGHLKGNRFRIRIRGCVPEALSRAQAVVEALASHGLPNAFGPQRFGKGGANIAAGRALLEGAREGAPPPRDRFLRRLYVSSFQAHLFNEVLGRRLRDGLFERALPGDVMKKLDTGGVFVSQPGEADGPRVLRFEISPTGPLFGHQMRQAEREVLAREQEVLEEEGLTLSSFERLGRDAPGTRRALRVPVRVEVFPEGDGLLLCFSLEKGSYATAVLREVMKEDEANTAVADALEDEKIL